ncbi:MAG: hypothetical protein ACQKBT_08200, partial [Puniceicoccales bacterium]
KKKDGEYQWAEMHQFSYWNNSIDPQDLSFYRSNVYQFKPIEFTEKGAPIYGPEGVERVIDASGGGQFPYYIPEDDTLIVFGRKQRPNLVGYDKETKEMTWSYPNDYSGVHGSHKAPIASPGMIIGTLKVMGHAEVEGIGQVFAMRGNQGEDYYMTSDGLFIGSIFKDSRITANNLGSSIEETIGYPLEGQPDEPFSGWFGRQNDGVYRAITSLYKESAIVVEIRGLESVHRFKGPAFQIDAEGEAVIADYDPLKKVEETVEAQYTVMKMAEPLSVESATGWTVIPALELDGGTTTESATLRIGYDEENLYLSYEVKDRSPMMNRGRDFKRLFKTGDAVDLQIGSAAVDERKDPENGDSRLLFSFLEGEPVAVLMRPLDSEAPAIMAHTYDSSVGPKKFDRVELVSEVQMQAGKQPSGYYLRASVPWTLLGIQPESGMTLYGDLGFISSDANGMKNVARTYWSKKDTGLVSDEPLEAWFFPQDWGTLLLE